MKHALNCHLRDIHSCDVLIIGGGPAGIAASISATRMGHTVAMVERSGQLGGMMTLGNVSIFMPVGNMTGFYAEMLETHCPEFYASGDPDHFKRQFNTMHMRYDCLRRVVEAGVKLYLHAQFLAVLKDDAGNPCGAAMHTREGLGAITAKVIIDCSGDGQAAIDAGVGYTSGREEDGATQPMTLMFEMQDTGAPVKQQIPSGAYTYDTIESLPQGRLLFFDRNDEGQVLVNMTRVRGHGAKDCDVVYAELEAMRQLFGVADYLQRHKLPNHRLTSIAPQIGVRETYQIECEYTLTKEDILQGKKFSDVVTQTNYEVDIHNPTGDAGCEEYDVPLYDIPYRCMVPKNIQNMLVAGRCISTDHVAMSSMRVVPTCFGLGQAAGIAAAIAIDENCQLKDVSIARLHSELKKQGVELQ